MRANDPLLPVTLSSRLEGPIHFWMPRRLQGRAVWQFSGRPGFNATGLVRRPSTMPSGEREGLRFLPVVGGLHTDGRCDRDRVAVVP